VTPPNVADPLVAVGNLVGDPDQEFRIVTLSFLADGGDGYPFPDSQPDRFDLSRPGVRTGSAAFADDGTEQNALAEYLAANFPDSDSAFNHADVGRELDERLQNLFFRSDSVLEGVSENFELWLALNSYISGGFDMDSDLGVTDPWKTAIEGIDCEVVSSVTTAGEISFTLRLLGSAPAKFWRHDLTGN